MKVKLVGVKQFGEKIKKITSFSFNGTRVLDLGCNAGFYSVQASLSGAREVIAIERNEKYIKQANFTKRFFENKYGKDLNIKIIQKDISEIDFSSIGKFDIIFAIAILYHIGNAKFGRYSNEALQEQEKIVSYLTKISNKIIVRTKTSKPFAGIDHFDPIFLKYGFNRNQIIKEGKRSLALYTGDFE